MEEARQDPPFAVQIELVEGCSLSCPFCGIQAIRSGPGNFKYASERTLEAIFLAIQQAGWNPRIEFAMHGEPSLHPNLIEILQLARRILPKHHLMMTSNGAGFVSKHDLREVLKILNVVALDDYEHATYVQRIKERYPELKFLYYPQNKDANPHRRRCSLEHDLVIVEDIRRATFGTHSVINNHAGSAGPPKRIWARCAKPFRELSFRWDGTVAICCNDWKGEYFIGKVDPPDFDIEALWNSKPFQIARMFLYRGNRFPTPCNKCDALSHRVGLLPDKYGKAELPEPTEQDMKWVEEWTK